MPSIIGFGPDEFSRGRPGVNQLYSAMHNKYPALATIRRSIRQLRLVLNLPATIKRSTAIRLDSVRLHTRPLRK